MKHVHGVVAMSLVAVGLLLCSGCVSNMFAGGPSPAGFLYTDVTVPSQNLTVATDSSARGTKQGTASAWAVLGLIAGGNGGIDAAMRDGNITKVHHVDHTVNLILGGIWMQNTVVVRGE